MKLVICFFILHLTTSLFGQPTGVLLSGGPLIKEMKAMNVYYYDLDLTIDPDKKFISGSVDIYFTVTEPITFFNFQLDTTFTIHSIMLNNQPTDFVRTQHEIFINAMDQWQPSRYWVKIFYSGHPRIAPNPPWNGGFSWEKTGSGEHWVGVTCQLQGSDIWFPSKDHQSDKADSASIRLTVPKNLTALSNGRLIETIEINETQHQFVWHMQQPINNYNITLNIGPYQKLTESFTSISGNKFPVNFWALPESVEKGKKLLPQIIEHLEFLESLLGPYPFQSEKYDVVETSYLGMEHSTIIAYGNKFKNTPLGYDWLHFHELAHEWFGNLITATNWQHFWIQEGMANYAEAMFIEKKYGRGKYYDFRKRLHTNLKNEFPIAPNVELFGHEIYQNGDYYAKSASALHMIRYMFGKELVEESLRRFAYPKKENEKLLDGSHVRYVTTQDYELIISQLTGQDLTWLFDVYFREKGLPKLVGTLENKLLKLKWETPNNRIFHLPVEIVVNGDLVKVDMINNRGEFRLPENVLPEIDAYQWILMEKPEIKIIEKK